MVNLLIVDDSKVAQIVLSAVADATNQGLETKIHCATTLAEALDMTEKVKPDLTFLDLNLPDSTIDDVLRAISGMTPPVIVVSGMPETNVRVGHSKTILAECYRAGAEGYIYKDPTGYATAQQKWLDIVLKKSIQSHGALKNDQI